MDGSAAGAPDLEGPYAELRRRELGARAGRAYLDHALRAPLPARVRRAVADALEACAGGSAARPAQAAAVEATRDGLGRLLGWGPDSVAFVQNTTAAVATLAQAVPWAVGDRVLVHADEVPGNVLPWRALARRGVRLDRLDVLAPAGRLDPADLLERALGRGPVRVVSAAAVALPTGERRDLRRLGEIVRGGGGLFCVDAAQALGWLRLDLEHVDAVFASGRKWLLGPPDVGILALRPGLAERLVPPAPGASSQDRSGAWRPEARRFEGGALPAPLLAGLGAGLELLAEVGPEPIERRVLELAAEAGARARAEGFAVRSPEDEASRSAVVHLEVGGPRDLEERLRARGVHVRVVAGRLRLSPHFWSEAADLDRLFAALREEL